MRAIRLRIDGTPMPKGSKTILPAGGKPGARPILADARRGAARKAYAAWNRAVCAAAVVTMQLERRSALTGAIAIDATFYLRRPAAARKRAFPTVKPDLDKLLRAALDPMSGIVFRDDCLIVDVATRKRYAEAEPYAVVTISEVRPSS